MKDSTTDDRVLLALHHKTLPRLAEAGIIELDRRTDTVRYHGHELVESLLAFIAGRDE